MPQCASYSLFWSKRKQRNSTALQLQIHWRCLIVFVSSLVCVVSCLIGCADSKPKTLNPTDKSKASNSDRKGITDQTAIKNPAKAFAPQAKTLETAKIESAASVVQSDDGAEFFRLESPVVESLPEKSQDHFAGVQVSADTTVLELEKKVSLQQLSRICEHETLETLILDGGIEAPSGFTEKNAAFSHLKQLVKLKKLFHLRIRNCKVDDDGIELLSKLSELRILNLPQANFSDAAMQTLAKMPNLELLRFSSEKVTDAGIQFLAKAKSLRALHLIRLDVSDQIVPSICAIKPLETFYVDGSKMTDDGYSKLIETRPDLHLHVDQVHLDYDPRKH